MAGALTRAGRYQIISELGRGSMGIVFQGFDPVIGRTVAIKTMLLEGLSPSEFEEYKARFQREAQAAGVLAHPNIVTVYDFGEDSGVLFLAMELLEGRSLHALVEEQGILPVETIIPMFEQVCSALGHAHTKGIVHRDVKPANIMLLESGLVKMTDFGIAKVMSMGMTQAGQILGTPNYMSPEQVKGRPIDGRSDIFSLGVILYELVTGEKPFGGQNITTVIYKIINENPISPRELDATIHPGLSYVIQKALAKSVDERYQTCRELAEDLKNFKSLGGMAAPSATVIVRVPPIQGIREEVPAPSPPPPPAPSAVPPAKAAPPAEVQPPRPLSVQVIPPQKPQVAKKSSASVWLLAIFFLVAGVGGGYYFFLYQQGGPAVQTGPAPQPGTQPPPTDTLAPGEQTATTPGDETGVTGTPTAETPGPTRSAPDTAESKPAPEVTEPPEAGPPLPSRPAGAPRVGQLVVRTVPDGAKIMLDGKSNPSWVTPVTIADVPAGRHVVVISKEGYGDEQRILNVEGGRTVPLDLRLRVPTGVVSVVTEPPGAEVVIDGEARGRSPVEVELPLGQHSYTITLPGSEPVKGVLNLNQEFKTLRVKGGGPQVQTGIVMVSTIPHGATVYANGEQVGATTPTSFSLSVGAHTLTISLPGYKPVQRRIEVPADGSTTSVNERLSAQ